MLVLAKGVCVWAATAWLQLLARALFVHRVCCAQGVCAPGLQPPTWPGPRCFHWTQGGGVHLAWPRLECVKRGAELTLSARRRLAGRSAAARLDLSAASRAVLCPWHGPKDAVPTDSGPNQGRPPVPPLPPPRLGLVCNEKRMRPRMGACLLASAGHH